MGLLGLVKRVGSGDESEEIGVSRERENLGLFGFGFDWECGEERESFACMVVEHRMDFQTFFRFLCRFNILSNNVSRLNTIEIWRE